MSGRQVLTTSRVSFMSALWSAGCSIDEIAEAMGISRWTIVSYMKRYRDVFPNRKHHADWWRERLGKVEGMSSRQAAARLGCSYEAVCYWRRRLGC